MGIASTAARVLRARGAQFGAALAVPAVRRLWLAQTVSDLGDWAARLALSVLAFHSGGGALGAAGVWIASTLPYLGLGQVLATLADRYPHRRVVLVCNLVRAGLFGLLALVQLPVAAVLLVAFLAALADPPAEAAVASALPQLAGGAYGASQALFSATAQLSVLVGYGAGGVLLAAVGAQAALALNAVSFAVNGLLVFGLPGTRAAGTGEPARTTLAYLREGAAALWRDPLVRWAVLLVNAGALSGMAVEATVVAYADHLGHGAGAATGLLALVVPAAAVVASGLWPNTGTPERLLRVLAGGTVALTGSAALLYLADLPLPGAALPLVLFGAMEVSMVPAVAVVMPRLPQATRGSSVGFLQGSLRTVQMVGAALGGGLALAVGVPLAMALLAVPSVLVGIAALVAAGRAGRAAAADAATTDAATTDAATTDAAASDAASTDAAAPAETGAAVEAVTV